MKRISDVPKFKQMLALAATGALGALTAPSLPTSTLSLYLGASHISNSDVRIHQPNTHSDATFHDVSWDSDSFSNPIFYGIRPSLFLKQRPEWGVGPDFTHDKAFAKTARAVQVDGTWNGVPVNEVAPINLRVQEFNISHGLNTLALNGYHRWSPRAGSLLELLRCLPYAGGGPTYYVLHAENTINGRHNKEDYSGGGFGFQMLAGLHFRIAPMLGVFIEAKQNRGDVEVDIAGGGHARTTLTSTQFFTGVSIGF